VDSPIVIYIYVSNYYISIDSTLEETFLLSLINNKVDKILFARVIIWKIVNKKIIEHPILFK